MADQRRPSTPTSGAGHQATWRAPAGSAVALALLAISLIVPAAARADRAFTPRFSRNDTGNITIGAAPLMTCSENGTNGSQCAAARGQDASSGPLGSNNIDTQNNNNYTMVNVNTDGDPVTTVNSSTATLTLPAGATVLFAGLYWGADNSAGNNSGAGPASGTDPQHIKFKPAGGTYSRLTAAVTDFGTSPNATRYQSFVEVTAAVAAAGSGTYSAGDVAAGTGGDRYAGWALVVAYRDPAQPARNLTVFDGFKTIVANAPPTTIPVSGFQTPPAGAVHTTLGFISYEGDLGLGGDTASLNGITLGNAANQFTNFFNSSISNNGAAVTTRDPAYLNTLGYDADLLNEDAVLANGATNATIGLTTNSDQYLPGVVTFATELYAPAISLVKSATNVTHPNGPDQRGDVLRYTVTARNTGQDGADNFILTDPIPANATYVANSLHVNGTPVTDAAGDDTGEYSPGPNQVVFRLGEGANATLGGRLAPGVSVPVTFDVKIGDVPPRSVITNAASATFVTQSLRVPLTAASNPVTNTVAAPDLTMTKTHSSDFVAGGTSTLELVVSNVGNLSTDGSTVTVTDTMPAGFASFANPVGDGWTCSTNGRTITCSRSGVLAPGASFPPIFIDVTIADPAPASIVNTATVSGGGDANPTNNTATDTGGTAQRADLQITKTATPATVLSGQTVQFTLTVLNAGPSTATAVTVDDPLGGSYRNVVATPSRGSCTTAVHCSLGALARGESATITISATVAANDTTLTNTATVSSTTPDPTPANNSASASITVAPTADLRVTKTPSTTSPTPGLTNGLTYTIVATNDGPSAAAGVVINDVLPPDFTVTSVSRPAGFTCTTGGTAVVCSGGTIAARASATLTVTGTVSASPTSLTLVNTAQVSAVTGDPNLDNNSATATVHAQPLADIGVTKVWGGTTDPFTPISTTAPNSDVRVLLSVSNFGPSPATGVVVSDPLPAGVTFVSSDEPACSGAGGITCDVGSLASGATFSVHVTVHVALSDAGQTLINTATGHANEQDPVDSNNRASSTLAVGTAADVAMQKRALAGSASVGDNVTFTLIAHNNGPSAAAGVQITDTLPAGLSFVSASSGCALAGATITCTIGTLADGDTATFTLVAHVDREAAGRSLSNSATVRSTTQDPVPANNTDSAAEVIAQQSDLSIVKRPSASIVALSTNVTYTLTAANAGPNDATGVTVSDAVPAGMLFVSADPGCTFSAGTSSVTCAIGTLASGTSRDVTITLRPQSPVAGQTVTNSATITGDQPDPNFNDNTSNASILVSSQADLAIAKTASAPTVPAGGKLTYTLVVSNAGPNTAPGVIVDDPLPAGTAAESATPSQGTCTITGGHVGCSLGDLPNGGQAQVVIVVDVAASAGGSTLVNAASVQSGIPDPNTDDNRSSVSTTVTPAQPSQPGPSLAITKTVDRKRADTSDRLTFEVTVQNRAAAAATGVVVTDTFGRPVKVLSVKTTAGTCTPKPLSCRIASLAAGARAVITIVARATTPGRLINGASVTAANGPGAVAAPVSVYVVAAPTSLSLRKRASRTRVKAFRAVSYRLTLRNRGANPALAVQVCDRLPHGLTLRSAPGARVKRRTVCWTIPRLAGHARRTFTINARAADVSRVRRVRNRATAKGSNTAAAAGRATIAIVPAPPLPLPVVTG